MTEQLKEIGTRLRAMHYLRIHARGDCRKRHHRRVLEYGRTGRLSFSFLYNCAEIFGIDVYEL